MFQVLLRKIYTNILTLAYKNYYTKAEALGLKNSAYEVIVSDYMSQSSLRQYLPICCSCILIHKAIAFEPKLLLKI